MDQKRVLKIKVSLMENYAPSSTQPLKNYGVLAFVIKLFYNSVQTESK